MKHEKLIFLTLCITLLLISCSYATNNTNETGVIHENSTTTKTIKTAQNEYYVNASVKSPGDGSKNNPWKEITQDNLNTIANQSTLHVSNGNYIINDLKINSHLTIIGEEENKTILKTLTDNSIMLTNNMNLTIINITIQDAQRRQAIENKANLTLKSVTLKNNTGLYTSEGSIHNTGNLTISDCYFTANNYNEASLIKDDSQNHNNLIIIKNTLIESNMARYQAALLYIYNSNILINNTTIQHNGDDRINKLMHFQMSNVLIQNTRFLNNNINHSTVYFMCSNASFTNVTFKNNQAKTYAASIHAQDSNLYINTTTFDKNRVVENAAAGIFAQNSNISINNTNFTNNKASVGTCIVTINGTTTTKKQSILHVNHTNFINNTAEHMTAGIYSDFTNMILDYLKFNNNTAEYSTCLYANMLNLNINHVNFTKNTAYYYPSILESYNTTITLRNSKFNKNIAAKNYELYIPFTGKLITNNNTFDKTNTIRNTTLLATSSDYNTYHVNMSIPTTLPNYYNLVDLGYVTPVKQQGSGGNCWTFASLATLESCILKATNKSLTLDLSEDHMKNMLNYYSKNGWFMMPNDGGFDTMSMAYLINWMGAALENDDIYNPANIISPKLESIIQVNNIYAIPKRSNALDNDLVKKAIMTFGAVYTNIYVGYSYNGYNFYYSGESKVSHAVTLVGWDDNYSKNNFRETPDGDGAYILKNSWGNSSGKDGYYYVSYYDTSILQQVDDMQSVGGFTYILTNDKYDKIMGYDNGITWWYVNENSPNNITYSCEYNITEPLKISAFGTYIYNTQSTTNYIAKIYLNGNLNSTQKGSFTKNMIYQSIKLNKPVNVNLNDKIKIELTLTSKDEVAVPISETDYTRIIPNTQSQINGENYLDCLVALKLYANTNSTTKIILNTPTNIKINQTTIISGKLISTSEIPIVNQNITVKIDNKKYNLITDSKGEFSQNYTPTTSGIKQLQVTYNGNGQYQPTTSTQSINIKKLDVTINIVKIYATLGETITLNATLKDELGRVIKGGNIVFKINGVTLKTDDTFNHSGKPQKFSITNGNIAHNIEATIYIRDAKNLTVTYSGSTYFNNVTSNISVVDIAKRYANMSLMINTTKVNQKDYIKITAHMKDSTPKSNKTLMNTTGYIIIKVDGVTLKDKNGKQLQIKVNNSVGEYSYLVPLPTKSTDASGKLINHEIIVIFSNNNYYPTCRANTTFVVNKNPVKIQTPTIITINKTSAKINLKTQIKDTLHNTLTSGTINFIIKINGVTLKNSTNQNRIFTAKNGKISLDNINIPKARSYETIEIVLANSASYTTDRLTLIPKITT